ncbi:MAG TPA: helix-turn-helix domain-containing protein [Jiangellaceae bacterium]|nr:helix-turn-helix domain-containing protein [Jiangellaceae bacterium]
MTNLSQLLTTAQVAEQLGVSVRTVNRLVHRGKLPPAEQIGGRANGRALAHLFDARDVENYRLRRELAKTA